MTFKNLWHASFEVTFIPLVMTYVLFVLCLQIHVYLAFIPLALYVLMCLFFILADILDKQSHVHTIGKLLFCLVCVSPMLITLITLILTC